MMQVELIDEHVSLKQCQSAVDALLKHEKKRQEKLQESQLLPGKELNVWLVLTVKQMHPEKKLKPHKIPILHPLVDPRDSAVCLITKDPQREYKDLLEEHKIRFVSRVVGVEKLKGKFKAFEARRLLLKENDLFLADERVVPLLPKLLGKKFFEAKKQPIPVNLTRKDLKGELERAISSTYFHQNQGTCSSVKVGTLSQTPAQVLANLTTALPAIVKAVKGGWDNVQSFNIKTNSSASLPIWSCELGVSDGGRWAGLVRAASDASEEEADGGNGETEEEETMVKTKAKGKKRAADDDKDAEEVAQPKKKAKASKSLPADELATKPKERKKQNQTPSEPVTLLPLPDKSSSPAGAATQPSTSLSGPSAKKKQKKARASATDFFDDAQDAASASRVTPTDTTATDGTSSAPSSGGSKKAGSAEQGASEGESRLKKARHKKTKASVDSEGPAPAMHSEQPSSDETPAAAPGAGGDKKKRQKKDGDAITTSAAAAASTTGKTVSVDDVKQKRGLNSGLEKKKEKLVRAKRSAKDALIGKKGL